MAQRVDRLSGTLAARGVANHSLPPSVAQAIVSGVKSTENAMSLVRQIETNRKKIRTDGYPMSVGELANMYQDDELDLHPEFQRFFRWSKEQKSRLIESILLGIPLPSIFVSQRKDGVWDVVDGLQRLSTIFQLMGILKTEDGKKMQPLILTKTKYLPALDGMAWQNANNATQFDDETKRLIKRAKLDIKILLRESDESTKYELFQRLNTAGSHLSDQELRNCLLVMTNRDAYEWLRELSRCDDFQTCIGLSDRAEEEQYDLELVVRFLVFRQFDPDKLKGVDDLGGFLDDVLITMVSSDDYDFDNEAKLFRRTFEILAEQLGDDAFRRFAVSKRRFAGGFLVSAFEVLALGVGYHAKAYARKLPLRTVEVAQEMWADKNFATGTGSGIRAPDRLRLTLPYGRERFAP